jgi:hypothetical protein
VAIGVRKNTSIQPLAILAVAECVRQEVHLPVLLVPHVNISFPFGSAPSDGNLFLLFYFQL